MGGAVVAVGGGTVGPSVVLPGQPNVVMMAQGSIWTEVVVMPPVPPGQPGTVVRPPLVSQEPGDTVPDPVVVVTQRAVLPVAGSMQLSRVVGGVGVGLVVGRLVTVVLGRELVAARGTGPASVSGVRARVV